MSDFATTWKLSRSRLDDVLKDLDHGQLIWKIHPNALSIGQMAVHVAGVEVSFASQLSGLNLDEADLRLKAAATDGSVNDKPYPYSDEELTPEFVAGALAKGRELVGTLLEEASPEVRTKEIVSALGPVITGEGAFARLGFHPGYHQGQAYLIRMSPDFPVSA
jgi:DinB superfamily